MQRIVTEKRAAQAVSQHWIVEKDRLEKEAAKAQRRGDEAEYERLVLKVGGGGGMGVAWNAKWVRGRNLREWGNAVVMTSAPIWVFLRRK